LSKSGESIQLEERLRKTSDAREGKGKELRGKLCQIHKKSQSSKLRGGHGQRGGPSAGAQRLVREETPGQSKWVASRCIPRVNQYKASNYLKGGGREKKSLLFSPTTILPNPGNRIDKSDGVQNTQISKKNIHKKYQWDSRRKRADGERPNLRPPQDKDCRQYFRWKDPSPTNPSKKKKNTHQGRGKKRRGAKIAGAPAKFFGGGARNRGWR